MKNNVLRVAAITLALFFVLSLSACGNQSQEQYPTPTDKFFVNDFAGVMTESDINTIYNAGAALNDATTAQAVVVTVESLDGKEPADYALELGRQWGVGAKDEDNGVVILLSEGDREIYIAVGYGLEGALPDSKTGRIIDTYGMSYFSSDNFSAGLVIATFDVVTNGFHACGTLVIGFSCRCVLSFKIPSHKAIHDIIVIDSLFLTNAIEGS